MYEPTVPMALMDYLPVLLFGVGALYFLRIGYRYLGAGMYGAMAGGAVLCFTGGFYKATAKMLDATVGYNIVALEASQFIMMAPGFVLLFVAAIGLLTHDSCNKTLAAAAPAMEMWKLPFIAIMTLANMGFLVAMAVFGYKNRLRVPVALYSLSIVAMFVMSYLSTRPFTTGMHWLAQSVNCAVQILALAGHITLYRGLISQAKPQEVEV